MSSPREAMIVQAVRLAYFIHRDQEIASRIAAESMIRLKSVAIAQDRRFLYEPSGRSSRNARTRNKITLSELHLLQRIVFLESEPYERETEKLIGTTGLGEQRLIIHYIKHLVGITLKRNSFYATLGITRLLCRYTTAEAMDLYNVVVQDPARVKDDYYWRSRKGHLMQDMKERFGDFVITSRGPRGEERFQACDDSSRQAPLVKKCLEMFTPWKTSCPLPAGLGPVGGEISALHFTGNDPDQEHRVELARMHAIFHLDCLERLLAGLSLPAFFERLELPRFFFSQGGNQHSGQSSGQNDGEKIAQNGTPPDTPPQTTPPEAAPSAQWDESEHLNNIDVAAIERQLDEYDESRQHAGAFRPDPVSPAGPAQRLRILVDGIERATLEPGRQSQVRLEIAEGAEMIEVRTVQSAGDILLATHLLSYDELQRTRRPDRFVTSLGRNQKISFTITPVRPLNDEPPGASVEIGYQETSSLLWFGSVWTRLRNWLPVQSANQQLALMRYALPLLLLATTAGAIWLYLVRQSDSQPPLIVSNASPTPVVAPPLDPALPAPTTGQTSPSGPGVTPKLRGKFPPLPPLPTPNEAAPDDTTRDPNATATAASLLAVHKIYIELAEGESFNPALRDQLNAKLQASQRWTTATADDADAALMVTTAPANPAGQGERGVIAQLVNEDGRVIWNQRKRIYRGSPEQIAAQIVADLLALIRQSEKAAGRR